MLADLSDNFLIVEMKYLVWAQGENIATERRKKKAKGRRQAIFYANKFRVHHPYPSVLSLLLFALCSWCLPCFKSI